MSEPEAETPALKKMGPVQRRAVNTSGESMVRIGRLLPDSDLPLLVQPNVPGLDLVSWAANHRDLVEQSLLKHGGILFRGFNIEDAAGLETFVQAVSGGTLEYKERSSPRSAVSGNIYTSTDYPPEYPIFLHNENSYQSVWPLRVFFFCHTPSETGGETPIADCRRVFEQVSPEVRERFRSRSWMYVRNFGDGFGLPWQTVFQTSDKAQVTEYCADHGIEVEWKEGDRLRTRAIRNAMAKHPRTGEVTWFNHATFFHVSTLEPDIREALLEEFSVDELPANTYYGDGTPIEPETLDHLREIYGRETRTFPWQKGDLLMLDNMLVAHGRAPYSGQRKILVAMAEPILRDR